MKKMKITAIVSAILCIVLATSLVFAVLRYDAMIQEQIREIQRQKEENWNLMQNWIRETLLTHSYWEGYTGAVNPNANLTDLELNIFLKQHALIYETILDNSDPGNLENIIFHVSKKSDSSTFGLLSNVTYVYQQIRDGFAPNNVTLNPEFEGNLNFTATLDWISENFYGIPICLNVFEGGDAKLPFGPNVMLGISEIQQAKNVADVRMVRFVEMISWYMAHPDLQYPREDVRAILQFCKNNNLKVVWSEWKISDDVWASLNSTIAGYEDIVTYAYQTNNEYNDPMVGFLHAMQFKHWGGSIQSWYWNTTTHNSEMEMPVELIVNHTKLARNMGAEIVQFEPYWYFFDNNGKPSDAMKSIWSIS